MTHPLVHLHNPHNHSQQVVLDHIPLQVDTQGLPRIRTRHSRRYLHTRHNHRQAVDKQRHHHRIHTLNKPVEGVEDNTQTAVESMHPSNQDDSRSY